MSLVVRKQIYNALDPSKPADDKQYLDCSPARGGGVFFQELTNRLSLGDSYLCTLFTGHIGSGKSSELVHVSRQFLTQKVGGKRYFPVLVDAHNYIDEFDADITDVLLAMVTELAATLKEETGIELGDGYFTDRLKGLKNLLLSDVEVESGAVSLFGNKIKMKLLKEDGGIRASLRNALGHQPSLLHKAVNDVLDDARKQLRGLPGKQRYDDFILIIDNLEKIQVVGKKGSGIESQTELFIEHAPQLTRLQGHMVYTVPLRLAREFGPQLGMRYDQEPFVLPMVMVRDRSRPGPHQGGVDCMKQMLAARIAPHSLDKVFAADALEFLVTYSGGNPRHLIRFVQSACAAVEDLPITLTAAQRAVRHTVESFSTSIPGSHWAKLAQLDRSSTHLIDNQDTDYMEMLDRQSILEYLNGSGDDFFKSFQPWYVVHPIVRELQGFKSALKELQTFSE